MDIANSLEHVHTPGVRYNEVDDGGYCLFCCRRIYYSNTGFCDRACETRKRQLSWKSANIGNHVTDKWRPPMAAGTYLEDTWREGYQDLPRTRRNRYAWGREERGRNHAPNYMHYQPSWDMYGDEDTAYDDHRLRKYKGTTTA